MILWVVLFVLFIPFALVIIYKLNLKKKKIETFGPNNIVEEFPNKTNLNTSFHLIRNEIIKEKLHPIKQAEERFEEGVKNQNLGLYDKSLTSYSKALEVFTKKDYPYVFAAIENNMGAIYRELAQREESERYLYAAILAYEETIDIYATLGYVTELAMTYNNLALVYQQHGDLTGEKHFYYDAIQAYFLMSRIYVVCLCYAVCCVS